MYTHIYMRVRPRAYPCTAQYWVKCSKVKCYKYSTLKASLPTSLYSAINVYTPNKTTKTTYQKNCDGGPLEYIGTICMEYQAAYNKIQMHRTTNSLPISLCLAIHVYSQN